MLHSNCSELVAYILLPIVWCGLSTSGQYTVQREIFISEKFRFSFLKIFVSRNVKWLTPGADPSLSAPAHTHLIKENVGCDWPWFTDR